MLLIVRHHLGHASHCTCRCKPGCVKSRWPEGVRHGRFQPEYPSEMSRYPMRNSKVKKKPTASLTALTGAIRYVARPEGWRRAAFGSSFPGFLATEEADAEFSRKPVRGRLRRPTTIPAGHGVCVYTTIGSKRLIGLCPPKGRRMDRTAWNLICVGRLLDPHGCRLSGGGA